MDASRAQHKRNERDEFVVIRISSFICFYNFIIRQRTRWLFSRFGFGSNARRCPKHPTRSGADVSNLLQSLFVFLRVSSAVECLWNKQTLLPTSSLKRWRQRCLWAAHWIAFMHTSNRLMRGTAKREFSRKWDNIEWQRTSIRLMWDQRYRHLFN